MLSFFEFGWKLLVILAVASTFAFGSYLLARPFWKRTTGRLANRAARATMLGFTAIAALAIYLLAFVDRGFEQVCSCSLTHASSGAAGLGLTHLAVGAWILGAVGLLARDTHQYWRLRARLGFNARILCATDQAPFSIGFVRPSIFIPRRFARRDRCVIFAHEARHLRSRDPWWNLLALVLARVCWFQPLMPAFQRRRVLAMEMATDEGVLRSGRVSAAEYARVLLAAAASAPVSPLALNAASGYEDLRARLENLRSRRRSRSAPWAWMLLLAGWLVGMNQTFASIRRADPASTEINMCHPISYVNILEIWSSSTKPESKQCDR